MSALLETAAVGGIATEMHAVIEHSPSSKAPGTRISTIVVTHPDQDHEWHALHELFEQRTKTFRRACKLLKTYPHKGDRFSVVLIPHHGSRPALRADDAYSAIRALLLVALSESPPSKEDGVWKVPVFSGSRILECTAKWSRVGPKSEIPPVDDSWVRLLHWQDDDQAILMELEPVDELLVDQYNRPATASDQDPNWREQFIRRNPLWTAREACGSLGRGSKNPSEYMRKLVERSKVFRLRHRGEWLYPRFQFDANGDALPVIGKLMALHGTQDSKAWRLAQWLDQANGYLPGSARPSDLLGSEPTLVEKAARRQFGPAGDVF